MTVRLRFRNTTVRDGIPRAGGNGMKSVRIHSYGDNSVVAIEDIERPVPGPGELLVRVGAAAVNPVDIQIREGKHQYWLNHVLPVTLGCDVAGTVEAGDGFEPGTPVYAYLNLARLGAFAEYAIVKREEAAAAPATLDVVHAASVPVAALTAWQALFDMANLEFGQTVLIHAAAGGVGGMAVQLAKWKGAHVIATASEANREYVGALGADAFIDYKSQRFEDEVSDVDVVLDAVGGETQERSFGVLKPGGILVTLRPPVSEAQAKAAGVRGANMGVQPDGARLKQVAQMFDDNLLRTLVEHRFPLTEAAKALERLGRGGVRGKIVLTVA